MEDDDADGSHGPSLAIGGRTLASHTRAYVGLGANLGDAAATIAAGAPRARRAARGPAPRRLAPLRDGAGRRVQDQPEFRNAVVALDVPTGPDPETGAVALLIALKRIERAFGRQERERWGPRELDLDLLVFGRHRIAVERPAEARSDDPAKPTDLVVPHRLAGERLFVLAPLADIAPRLVPPGWTETVATARARRERIEGPGAVRPIAEWAADGSWSPITQERPDRLRPPPRFNT